MTATAIAQNASPDRGGSIAEIDRRLRRRFRPTRLRNRRDALSELVFILLSGQTEEYNYLRTYRALRRRYRTWSDVRRAGEERVYQVIRSGGLGRKKARQIVAALSELERRFGSPSLAHLDALPDVEAERTLTSLPGVGLKTARCVLLYALDRTVFPVDTHVWRTLQRLGVVRSKNPKPTQADQDALQDRIPTRMRHRLHVNLVLQGREVCTAVRPKCAICPLADMCPSRPALTS